MARMFPQWIPDSEREANPGRRAEYLVYDCLAEQLGDDWLMLYSQAIKWAHPHGVSDREADFVVAHPDLGVVMLEVKGGGISHEGGLWYSTPLSQLDRPQARQQRYEIKNPYQQATGTAKSYERKLDDYIRNQLTPRQGFPQRKFAIATAVCFPDIDIPPGFHMAGDALPELTLCHADLPNLKDRLYRILKLYRGDSGQPPGPQGIELLVTVLARDWHIESLLAHEFETTEQRFKQLTDEQFQLLYSLEYNPRMLIAGCAGSGKTMLAAEKARQLADQGQRVLYACYNSQVAEWLKQSSFVRSNINVTNFHQLCRQYAAEAGLNLPAEWSKDLGISQSAYYSQELPLALAEAAEILELTFDAIIVDEGQDFEETWFQVLQDLLADKEKGIFYVFHDDNQKVYSKGRRIPFQWPKYRLTRNMRNCNPIFNLILKYYHQPQAIFPSGVSGPEPLFVSLNDYPNPYEAVQAILAQLEAQQIPPSHVAILTPQTRSRSLWGQLGRRSGKFTPVWQLDTQANQVTCSSIRTFKGLERPVIILTELDRMEPWQVAHLMYVAISRAKNYLIILGNLPEMGNE